MSRETLTKLLAPCLIAALEACVGGDRCSGDPPGDGALPERSWGSDGFWLFVHDDGTAEFTDGCSQDGDVAAAVVADGSVHWDVTWYPYSPAWIEPANREQEPAIFAGSFCGSTLSGTLSPQDDPAFAVSLSTDYDGGFVGCD